MDSIFVKDLKDENRGLRVSLNKEEEIITSSGMDIQVKLIDNQYSAYPTITIGTREAYRLAIQMLEIIKKHKNLLKSDFKTEV